MNDEKYANLLKLAEGQAIQIAALQNIILGLYATSSPDRQAEVRRAIDGVYNLSKTSGACNESTESIFNYTNTILSVIP